MNDREQACQQVVLPKLTPGELIKFPIGVVAAMTGGIAAVGAETVGRFLAGSALAGSGAWLAYKNIGPPTRFEPADPDERIDACISLGEKSPNDLDAIDIALLQRGSTDELSVAVQAAQCADNLPMLGYIHLIAQSRAAEDTTSPDELCFYDIWAMVDEDIAWRLDEAGF